jgi:hypothetical protein
MGIFALQSCGDYFARMLKAQLQRAHAKQERMRERMARSRALLERDGGVATIVEPLGCPRCKARYDIGDVCPTCDVELVGEAWIDAVEPLPVYVEPLVLTLARDVGFGVLSLVIVLGLAFAYKNIAPNPYMYWPGRQPEPRFGIAPTRPGASAVTTHGTLVVPERLAYSTAGRAVAHRLRVELDSSGTGMTKQPELHLLGPGAISGPATAAGPAATTGPAAAAGPAATTGPAGTPAPAVDCNPDTCTASTAPLEWGDPTTFLDNPTLLDRVDEWGHRGQTAVVMAPHAGTYTVSVSGDTRPDPDASPLLTVWIDGRVVFASDELPRSGEVLQVEFPRGNLTVL